jgi:hypothetical protein
LDGGLLVAGDGVLVRPERDTLKRTGAQVKDTPGFRAEVRSRMKIQDRYCQGLSTSSRSRRRTVDAETVSVIPRAVGSAAGSGQDQRDSGTPASAGDWQANALVSAICTG